MIANRLDFSVIDETEDYIVVDKPAPLLVHPTKPDGPRTLWDELRSLLSYELVNGGQLSIINRLDRETSGIVLVGKHRVAARHFGIQMQERRVRKTYRALVWGWPAEDEFSVDAPLLRQGSVTVSRIWLKRMAHPGGEPARTDFRVLRRLQRPSSNGDRFALVEARPETGRMHQIRVHLQHAGHPVVGDKIYGPDENLYLEFIESGMTPALLVRLLLPRHALHSHDLGLRLPDGREKLWTTELPTELNW